MLTAIVPMTQPKAEPATVAGVRCPECGEADTLAIRCHDAAIVCGEKKCEAEFTAAEIREHAGALLRLAKWAECCPTE